MIITHTIRILLVISILGVKVSASESLAGAYYFTQYIVYQEKGEEVKASEGVLYISQNKFSADEIMAIKKVHVIGNATNEWLDNYYSDKDICIETTPKPPGIVPDNIPSTISSGRKADNKISIQVEKWPDWAYFINLELIQQDLKMSGLGGSRAFGYFSERFEVIKVRNVGIKTCLSMMEASKNIWWPTK